MKHVFLTAVATFFVLLATPLLILATGLINMGATNEPGTFERSVAALAVQQSLALRAPERESPVVGDPQAAAEGMAHYAAMCVRCHGGPGVDAEEFAQGLNPPAPSLSHAAEEFTNGELFWITKHGIRMTGMPAFGKTHQDEEIWRIVAFLRELPTLSSEQQTKLREAVGQGVSHHRGDDVNVHHHAVSGEDSATAD